MGIKKMIRFIVLLLLYFGTMAFISRMSRSTEMITIAGEIRIPVSAFVGVFSSLGNICIILLTVLYNKIGFYTSCILLVVQFPILFLNIIINQSMTSIPGVFSNLLTIMAVLIIYKSTKKIEQYQKAELDNLKAQQKLSRHLFEQTATALVNAIDAKDVYSHGHSLRVAQYSEKIARMAGKDEEECRRIYFAGLLHDVGKIGIPISIINKKGRLTEEEYETIKSHPEKGSQILSSINEFPFLSVGALYHHERYDGKGYPRQLKGEDIPEIARIISVADAYDAMSSNRSYRKELPQPIVREEIVKGAGTQFDPKFAKIMQRLIDEDQDYDMREKDSISELAGRNELYCTEHRNEISNGILILPYLTRIHLEQGIREELGRGHGPSIILYDSHDGRYHDEDQTIREFGYFEYCEIWLDGHVDQAGARKIETKVKLHDDVKTDANAGKEICYEIEAVKWKDHAMVTVDDGTKRTEVIIALPDSSRFVYAGLTGEQCYINDVTIRKDEKPITQEYIPRIAEWVSYIDEPMGDIPNVQLDSYRTDASEGILLKKSLSLSFHTKSLPTAILVWHCPYFLIYSSEDGKVNGKDYKEYALIRLDGEGWVSKGTADNQLKVNHMDDFGGWEEWKEQNKAGFDCTATFERSGNVITMTTRNLGLAIKNTTTILDGANKVYVALTGDQCALTNIKVKSE